MHKVNKIKNKLGFTLIELLVVISIIGLLATVVLVSLNRARIKARDTRRQADMYQIVAALNLYYQDNGCLPSTSGTACAGAGSYSDANAGGWDYSSQGGFMTFLKNSGAMAKVPVDPLNTMTGDGSPAGTYAYRYYCYTSGPNLGAHLGYWRESDGAYVYVIGSASSWTDSGYACK